MQNDPIKTVCTTMFIVAAIQHIKIGDLSMRQSGFSLSSDAPAEDMMDTSGDYEQFPHGAEVGHFPIFSKDQERTLTRDSTAGFAGGVFKKTISDAKT
jgi:proteasome activator subunit 4